MLIIFDTEFTDLSDDPRLISIGLVSEDGREFYAELSGTYSRNELSDFTYQTVLPLLKEGETLVEMSNLKSQLQTWLEQFNCHVTLATDNLQWDWPWIKKILCESTWPINLEHDPLILNLNYIKNIDVFTEAVENAYAKGLRRHHALDDAKANRIGWLASEIA